MWCKAVIFVVLIAATTSDTCGQDRSVLGNWLNSHGSPSLLLEPIPDVVSNVSSNPYDDPNNPPPSPDVYCAMKWSTDIDPVSGNKRYHLKIFPDEASAKKANFSITHKGHCGACSSLQDLGVYMRENLTTPVRSCAMKSTFSFNSDKKLRECLLELGFSDMCTSIWAYNAKNTKDVCYWTCMWSYIRNEPFNKPDGSLNNCLQCDEDKSGPNLSTSQVEPEEIQGYRAQ